MHRKNNFYEQIKTINIKVLFDNVSANNYFNSFFFWLIEIEISAAE